MKKHGLDPVLLNGDEMKNTIKSIAESYLYRYPDATVSTISPDNYDEFCAPWEEPQYPGN